MNENRIEFIGFGADVCRLLPCLPAAFWSLPAARHASSSSRTTCARTKLASPPVVAVAERFDAGRHGAGVHLGKDIFAHGPSQHIAIGGGGPKMCKGGLPAVCASPVTGLIAPRGSVGAGNRDGRERRVLLAVSAFSVSLPAIAVTNSLLGPNKFNLGLRKTPFLRRGAGSASPLICTLGQRSAIGPSRRDPAFSFLWTDPRMRRICTVRGPTTDLGNTVVRNFGPLIDDRVRGVRGETGQTLPFLFLHAPLYSGCWGFFIILPASRKAAGRIRFAK
jgi:hypothetical protein